MKLLFVVGTQNYFYREKKLSEKRIESKQDEVFVVVPFHSLPAGPIFNLLCNKDKYILSPAISLEVLTLEKRYYTR